LCALGDIMLGDHPIKIGHGVGTKISQFGSKYIFEDVKSLLKNSDIVFGNLETVISKKKSKNNDIFSNSLRGTPESVEGLLYSGFNFLNLANNHTMGHGEEAFNETVQILQSNGINCLGLSKDSNNPLFFEKDGLKIGFLAYSLRPEESSSEPLYSSGNKRKIIDEISALRPNVDYIIISLHWGDEFVNKPSKEQIHLSHELIDSGADVLLGHHSHVLQGVEEYNNGIIAYSLGNFVFDMWQFRCRTTAILSIELTRDNIAFKLLPVFIDSNYRPRLVRGNRRKRFEEYFKKLNNKARFSLKRIDSNNYESQVEEQRTKYRWSLKSYFLTNFFNYNICYIFDFAKKFLNDKNPIK